MNRRTHGKSKTRLYSIWAGIKKRCLNPNSQYYKNYGGRGISVCSEWINFEPFYEWAVNSGYKECLSIDRINNEQGYSPDNCQWADRYTQARNSRQVIMYNNETASEASVRLGGDISLVSARLKKCGWSLKDAFTIPAKSLPNGYSLKNHRHDTTRTAT